MTVEHWISVKLSAWYFAEISREQLFLNSAVQGMEVLYLILNPSLCVLYNTVVLCKKLSMIDELL